MNESDQRIEQLRAELSKNETAGRALQQALREAEREQGAQIVREALASHRGGRS